MGNKLVEPSGSRSDRPGLSAMLKDASRGEFDVILAWREDRLYRGIRAMLTVLDIVKDYKIEILLAKENFDPKIAPIRAWVAQMELEGMKERMTAVVRRKIDRFDFNVSNFSRVDILVSLPCRQGRSRCRQGSDCFLN